MQSKYKDILEYKKQFSPVNNKFDIKYTKAQIVADEFKKTQSIFNSMAATQSEFKLKRF